MNRILTLARSRLTWSFARDKGLPFSSYFAHVDGHHRIPARAVTLVAVVIVLLSLINIGKSSNLNFLRMIQQKCWVQLFITTASSVALNAILSLSTISLYISYIIPITCLLTKRLRVSTRRAAAGEAYVSDNVIVFGPWTLGRWGAFINMYALCYACLMVPFLALPSTLPVTKTTMNYAGPVFCGMLVLAFVDYQFRGKGQFKGPAREIEWNGEEGLVDNSACIVS